MDSPSFRNAPVESSAAVANGSSVKKHVLRMNAHVVDEDAAATAEEKKTDVVADFVVERIEEKKSPTPSKSTTSSRYSQRLKMIVFDKDGTLGNDRESLRKWAEEMTLRARNELLLYTDIPTADIDRCLSKIHHAIGWDDAHKRPLPSALLAAGTWEEILFTFAKVLSGSMENVDEKVAIHNEVASWHSEIGGIALHSHDAPVIDDLPSLIHACRSADLLVAVCTSDDRKSTDMALDRWEIASLIDYSICGDEVPNNGKPSAYPLLELCKRAKVMPQECIVVGDTIADTGMARNAGAGLCIGVLSGSGERDQLLKAGADWIMDDVGELRELLWIMDDVGELLPVELPSFLRHPLVETNLQNI